MTTGRQRQLVRKRMEALRKCVAIPMPPDARARRVLELIAKSPEVWIPDLAAAIGLSVSRLERHGSPSVDPPQVNRKSEADC